jgi:hypothetical protein
MHELFELRICLCSVRLDAAAVHAHRAEEVSGRRFRSWMKSVEGSRRPCAPPRLNEERHE